MGSGLAAALDDIGDNNDRGLAGSRQLPQGGHAHGMPQRIQGGLVQAIPILGQALGVGNGLAGDENLRAVRKLRGHQPLAVFKIQFHRYLSLFSKIGADDFQVKKFPC